jgi:S1-C subfamily serine protease
MKRIFISLLIFMFLNVLKSQSIRSINLNQYKYIVIDEILGSYRREARKDVVKILRKAGYNVVNLSKPFKTHNDYPADLKENKNLALFLNLNRVETFSSFLVTVSLQNSNYQVVIERSGSSWSSTRSIKKALTSLIEFNYQYDSSITQKIEDEIIINKNRSNSWSANGTGFFIDSRGYIATNYHVINGANEIQVEFTRAGNKQIYQTRVVKFDKQNDLAIIKITDNGFVPFDTIPYNFQKEIALVGNSVFTLGFPMALSIMGEDIKFTDGKISSKTGFLGDVNSYQISVPIQPGNSGGPLFDFEGNLVGITSSTVNRKLDLTENVNYAIKTSCLSNFIDVLDIELQLPYNQCLATKSITDKLRILSDYVVLIKVK